MRAPAGPVAAYIGREIADARLAKGWTQARLARAAGVQQCTLSAWECGDNLPRVDALLAVAGALGVDVAGLLPPTV